MPPDKRSRREFLRYAAATALAAGVAGCRADESETPSPTRETPTDEATPTAEPTPTRPPSETPTRTTTQEIRQRYGDRFDSVVDVADAVEDGTDRIDDVVTAGLADDALLYFPGGRYRLGPLRLEGRGNVGMVSLPGEDVRIAPAEPAKSMDYRFLEFTGVEDFLLEGVTFDYTEAGYGGAVRVTADGDFEARDLKVAGKMPDLVHPANSVAFRFDVLDGSSTGLVENVVATDGGHEGGNSVGIYVGKDHAGELVFRDCEIANFPNNGLYASAPGRQLDGFTGNDGVVHVRGGRYANNNIANVRLGSTDSTAKGVSIVVDTVPPSPESSSLNVRGLRLRGREGQLVENCRIRIGADAGKGFGALVFHPDTGAATIRDTEIVVDRDGYRAINALPPTDGDDDGPVFENVTVSGAAAGGSAVAIRDRDGTTFRNCAVEQSGDERTGMAFADCDGCLVADSTIRVTGTPIRVDNASVERQGLTIESWTNASET